MTEEDSTLDVPSGAEAINQDRFLDPKDAHDPDAGNPENWWERAYASEDPVPWDTGDPQPVVEALADADTFADPVLDVGCGLGTHARALARSGHDVTGVDLSRTAIADARDAAADADVDATFVVGDALELGTSDGVLEVDAVGSVLDVGTFHTFESHRGDYADALGRVLEPGGRAFVLSFAVGAPDDWGPELVSRDDVREAFDGPGWSVVDFREEKYVTMAGPVPALVSVLERSDGPE
jgi:SAM-dependent methyltransferase